MKKRDHKQHIWLYILLGSIFFLWACSQTTAPAISQESITKESSMSTDIEKNMPPIDTAAPSIFETASFGLG
jgi:PBP1b-binding outer membrane lipoprotein LpoB